MKLKDWKDRLESDITHFLQLHSDKKPVLYVGSRVIEKALRKSRLAASICELKEDNPGAVGQTTLLWAGPNLIN